MSSEKSGSLSETWSARYDDRDDEDLAHHLWARRMAEREHALKHPISKDFVLPDPKAGDQQEAADRPQS
jgi:hypothetical protein